jgi:iron(III) transport system ATP-binding protein
MGRRYPHQLSGGQQQRVALARALAIGPQLVLLDEPFSALDPSLRAAVREEVRGILAQTGITTLLVTHGQEEALSIADQVAVLRDGVVAQFGTPPQLYHYPIDLEMARFLGDANLVDGVVEGARVTTALGSLALRPAGDRPPAPTGPAVVLLRPEQIVLSSDQGAAGVRGRIVRSEFYGHDSVIDVVCDQLRLGGHLRVRVQGATRLKEGAHVAVSATGDAQAWAKTA